MKVQADVLLLSRPFVNHVVAVSTGRTHTHEGLTEFITGAVVSAEYGALLEVGSGVVINSRRCVIAAKVLLEGGEWCLSLNEERWGAPVWRNFPSLEALP